ncbi:MAG: Protein YchN [Rhodocyclaceae bacterium]|nr:MAG: hypothetical protein F9K21_09905 [Rhodocyclaceae bacterium]MBE7424272.1 DsrE family protein [Zoogloeaceae bacterium]MBV6408494.1 Protein YchN [Rhodocyclaceae bacterium]MCK6384466.1 DsrE family protein [Rhodocyclaceae bacterium]CAG0929591.1 Protein YchN [Rhodocyclaceae bacterium]
MQSYLIVLNDPPYGTERSYNGLRLARSLLNNANEAEVKVFLMGDAASCAKGGQKVPAGYYNIGDMLGSVIRRKGAVAVCGTCMDARGIGDADLVPGALRGTMDLLTEWTEGAGKVLVF